MFEQTFKNIDDVLWKEAGCATELDYTAHSDEVGRGFRAKAAACTD